VGQSLSNAFPGHKDCTMHGAIFMQLKDFVVSHHGLPAWDRMLEMAGQPPMALYLPTQAYPDADAMALVKAACDLTGQSADTVLEQFGLFIAPALLKMYAGLVRPEWRTLDLLLNVEDTIHKVVRRRNPGAEPPELFFSRVDARTLSFRYESKRQMAALAVGIMKGVARHYGETIGITVTSATPEATTMQVRLEE
jgi:hypothetical protein